MHAVMAAAPPRRSAIMWDEWRNCRIEGKAE
jgi:hypothetical protein